MKRSPLNRKSAMKRTRARPAKSKTTYAKRERDWAYMGWIKTCPCAVGGGFVPVAHEHWPKMFNDVGPCGGVVEAHHAGKKGMGQKAPDRTCISLCSAHHRALTDRRPPFSGWLPGEVKAWELAAVAHYSVRYSKNLDSDGETLF